MNFIKLTLEEAQELAKTHYKYLHYYDYSVRRKIFCSSSEIKPSDFENRYRPHLNNINGDGIDFRGIFIEVKYLTKVGRIMYNSHEPKVSIAV